MPLHGMVSGYSELFFLYKSNPSRNWSIYFSRNSVLCSDLVGNEVVRSQPSFRRSKIVRQCEPSAASQTFIYRFLSIQAPVAPLIHCSQISSGSLRPEAKSFIYLPRPCLLDLKV